ncbi:hypothetical protein Acry_0694 [Acidiphilium cryptum JF-5]|uniref:Uncharacterized protein n=1 Tax=Acidiphilium cryptum (strain JF-5) TaxID=349163 RepID=A5FWD3_ACICJ|nr:hypothetical protein Acry_0694 [Acidiphilium cryptum JF-5]
MINKKLTAVSITISYLVINTFLIFMSFVALVANAPCTAALRVRAHRAGALPCLPSRTEPRSLPHSVATGCCRRHGLARRRSAGAMRNRLYQNINNDHILMRLVVIN